MLTDSRGAGYSYTYDSAGRMASMSINGVLQGSYRYDFAGRQAIRVIAATGVTIHSVFDAQGRRIAEYNEATGALIREYVWLGWEPVAVIEGGVVSYIRTDHIGRPVFATNSTTGVKTWTASYDPFGGVRTVTGAPISARFPGQWFQAESGLHQNWMRDYDPTAGRYLEADPLGLVDGASVYGYARQSPMMYTDPTGEFGVPGAIAGAIAGGIAGYVISGCWEGAAVGAVAGAAVGFTGGALGATAYGSGAAAFGGAAAGQVASNLLVSCACGSEPVPTAELITSRRFWINNFAAGFGGGFGSAFGNGIKSSLTKKFFGNPPYQGSLLQRTEVFGTLVTEGAGGVGAGIGEGLVAGFYSWWR